MGIRSLALCAAASLFLCGAAVAQTHDQNMGDTSSSAAGKNITPSTAVQKNRSSSKDTQNNMGSPAGGAPGVEGPAGSENGPAQMKPKNQ